MTIELIVEDGTGLANANTYVSQADADAYFASRANAAWASLDDDAKAAALIQATQYLDARYTYKGERLIDTQALEWPRKASTRAPFLIPGVPVPTWAAPDDKLFDWPVKRLIQACCELSYRASTAALYTDEGTQIVTQEKVDVISVTYADRTKNGGQIRFAIVDDLLKPLVLGGQYQISMARA